MGILVLTVMVLFSFLGILACCQSKLVRIILLLAKPGLPFGIEAIMGNGGLGVGGFQM